MLLLGVLKSVADVLRLSSSPHIWRSGVHGKETPDKLFFHATNRFLNFFSPMQPDKIFYVNLHVSKTNLKYLKQKTEKVIMWE